MSVLDPVKVVPKYLSNYSVDNINANSYDLRVDRMFEVLGGISIYADGTRELPKYREVKTYTDYQDRKLYKLTPGTLYQVETFESVDLPPQVSAITLMRSSMHKSGASGEVGLYDTGYSGKCGMTVSVGSECVVEHGASLFQLVFLGAETTHKYRGRYLDSKWLDRLIQN